MKRFIGLTTLKYLIKKCSYRVWTVLSTVGEEADFPSDQQMCWVCHPSGKKEPQSPIQSLFLNVLGCFYFNSMTFFWKLH